MGTDKYGINSDMLNEYAQQIKEVSDLGIQIGIVIGGGNIFRGLKGEGLGFDRVKGDQMGMLATVINSLAMQSALENIGVSTDVLTSIRMEPVAEFYSKDKAVKSMEMGRVVIFSGGTGNPYFTTDTASALRAVEIKADAVLKGTRVNGVYTADPEKDTNAKMYDKISFDEVYKQGLNVMDLTAFTMCKENSMPIIVFNMNIKGNLKELLLNGNIGTIVS